MSDEIKPRRFSLFIKIEDAECGSAAFSCDGRYLGHLIAYGIIALAPYFSGNEETDILADVVEGLPSDHPAKELVKLTNRAIAGDV